MVDATHCNRDDVQNAEKFCGYVNCICIAINWPNRPDLEVQRQAYGMIHRDSPLSRIVTNLIEDSRKRGYTWVRDGIFVRKIIRSSDRTETHTAQDALAFNLEIGCVDDISRDYSFEKWTIIVDDTLSQDPIAIHL